MTTILIVVHVLLAAALVGVILLQRNEGGALGIGGGGGFMSSRGTANLLTRTTAVLATAFMATSIILALLSTGSQKPRSIIDSPEASRQEAPAQPAAPAVPTR